MTSSSELSPGEKADAFRRATSGFVDRFAKQIDKGMTDADLESALKSYLGIFGGSGGPDCIDISFQGAGLKIWASHDVHNHVTAKPIFEGRTTLRMARQIYDISDPSDKQLPLL